MTSEIILDIFLMHHFFEIHPIIFAKKNRRFVAFRSLSRRVYCTAILSIWFIGDDFLKHFSVILYPLSGNRMIMALRRLH